MKNFSYTIIFMILAAVIVSGCGPSETQKLAEVEIIVDGNSKEWESFPIVHQDPEGDHISIELDISTVKAFVNGENKTMYMMIESYLPIQEFTSLELDLQYNGELYRVAFLMGTDTTAILAHRFGEDEWDQVTDLYGSQFAIDSAIELSFPVDKFTNPETLKIIDLRIMSGVCCNEFEWYAVDYIKDSVGIER